jgi:hypothetical protein
MATWDRITYPLTHLGHGRVSIAGRFRPNGSSAVSSTYFTGKGFTAAHTSTGKFTVTLNEGLVFNQIDHVEASLWLNAADDKMVQVGAVSASSRTIVINVWDKSGGAVADVASNANNWISFEVIGRLGSED